MNQQLLADIQRVHAEHQQNYGAVKTWRALNQAGIECGKHRVARLRRDNGVVAKRRRRFVATTRSKHSKWLAPNLLHRNFEANAPNRVWVGDVTFVPTREGWLYLAVMIDLYSRQVVGWAMSNRNNTELVSNALEMAIAARQPPSGLIHHTDQGQTYVAGAYRTILANAGMVPSMSRKGDCWDNAVAESFFATLEFELIDQQTFRSRSEAKSEIFKFIEIYYNRKRIHQTMNYQTPLQVENQYRMVA